MLLLHMVRVPGAAPLVSEGAGFTLINATLGFTKLSDLARRSAKSLMLGAAPLVFKGAGFDSNQRHTRLSETQQRDPSLGEKPDANARSPRQPPSPKFI
jgi:hypothetical protein